MVNCWSLKTDQIRSEHLHSSAHSLWPEHRYPTLDWSHPRSISSSTLSQLTNEYRWDSLSIGLNQRKASAAHRHNRICGCFSLGWTVASVSVWLLTDLSCSICSVGWFSSSSSTNRRSRLTALRGDLLKLSFGLDPRIFQSLVDDVNVILHPSAQQLTKDNAFGTREVLRRTNSHPLVSRHLNWSLFCKLLRCEFVFSFLGESIWWAIDDLSYPLE